MKSIHRQFYITLCFFFLSFYAMSQTKNYEADWKRVENLLQKQNLPKSALAEVKKIYTKAKAEKQDAQIIKSLVYMAGLQQQTREGNQLLSIKEIEKEITIAMEPAQSILQNMLAGMYWQYFQNNRWQLYNRTNTVNFNKADVATWTVEDFHKKISNLFLASIENEKILQQIKLEPFDAIIVKGNVRFLRPTLYDLLAHNALEYFQNNERDIKKPAYAFEINQPAAFAPAAQFVAHRFITKDTFSLQHKAILIYQKLIGLHLANKNKEALIDVDIDRIEFVRSNASMENKEELYETALKNLIAQHGDNASTAQANFLLAAYHNALANTYSPFGDTTQRYKKLEAKNILEKVVANDAKKTEGWANSYNLLQQITKENFSFEVEKVNLPAQPFRALVRYQNVAALSFRLIKADDDLKKRMERNGDEEKYWSSLTAATVLKNWQQTLPSTNDLQEHSVEIKIDALPVGEYYLLASANKDFSSKKTLMGAQLFHVSAISYINQGEAFFVLHRQSGQPLAKAAVTVYTNEYDYNTSRNTKTKLATYTTNNNGYFKVPQPTKERRRNNYFLDITYEKDRLNLNDQSYGYNYYNNQPAPQKPQTKIFFFTDRSIYRPGQTVFFKGIVVTKTGEQNDITQYKTTIYLRNANYQLTDSVQLTTNEFGSFNGKFVLPQNVLNGEFSITEKSVNSSVSISVEEYKRPKFAVDFEKIKASYKVGDSIAVTGIAKAYAGNNIEGAKVVYRVVREPRFLYPWLMWRSWLPRSEPMEIAHGETTTDNHGNFIVRFLAIPDKKIEKKSEPVFDYRVYADVTDINGESRSGENVVSAGYKSLILRVQLPEKIIVDSLKNISIKTENMNGEFQLAIVNVSVRKLIAENRLIRNRFWQQPDQFVMTNQEFVSHFPNDEYQNESDEKTWSKGEVLFTVTDSSRVNGQWAIGNGQLANGNKQLESGFYELTFTTKDKEGNEIKDVRIVELFDAKNNFAKPQYLWAVGSQGAVEPGLNTTVQIGSSANNVFLVSQKETNLNEGSGENSPNGNEPAFTFTNISNEKKSFNHTPTENERGGFGLNYFFVKDNRFYQFNDVINVPWSNKELQIEYATFRDKTLPGAEEKWKVKISGSKNEMVAAEMLASMYDASLDQFKPHSWSKPNLWPIFYNRTAWNGTQNFTSVQSQKNYFGGEEDKSFDKRYDELQLSLYSHNNLGGWLESRAAGMQMRNAADGMQEVVVVGYGTKRRGVTGSIAKLESAKFTPPSIVKDEEVKTDSTAYSETDKSADIPIQIRRNFNETAFFFPDLRTDASGAIEFSFTAPEALTKWKIQTLAHTKNLAFGLAQKELVTQKELMVQPNAPRFLRQGDRMEFPVKLVNLSTKEITGQVQLELFDAVTNQPVDGWFLNSFPNQYFTVAAGGSEAVNFPIQIPFLFTSTLTWRVTASTTKGSDGVLSDGEENTMLVLTNKILVTETLPMPMRGSGTKNFTFTKLLQSGNSETLQHQSLTVEYTSNPAWYAVQALPYLMEYPYECAEQNWNRYYANALATKIINSAPRIKAMFEKWKTIDTAALQSALQKNQELKSALLEETPWVLDAQNETQQKKNIALLFDLVRMNREGKNTLEKLKNMQSSNGGFVWFKGGPDDRYITQYIVTGIGHLKKLGVDVTELKSILQSAIPYLDKKMLQDYNEMLKRNKNRKVIGGEDLGGLNIQYLYMRSFFPEYAISGNTETAYNFYRGQSVKFWMKQGLQMQGMIALTLHRTGNKQTPQAILKSLKETSINHQELGRYWLNNKFGYNWHWSFSPIETQALMIEAFTEIGNDITTVDDLKTWLIKNKQTTNWRTTKATADACYAMLLQGTNWLQNEPQVKVQLGPVTFNSTDVATESGTGYFKKTIEAKNIKPEMGNIIVNVQQPQTPNSKPQTPNPSWGAVYWQYFEDMDKVIPNHIGTSTPLQLQKELFIEKNTARGPVLTPVNEGTELKVGDKIKVRIELRVDRDMEYVHMKDLRASAMEPVNILSGYKWQGGLGYYESTKDASTNFFFHYLQKGTYVFEYPLFVNHKGSFSNGITTIQCMYAPEFTAHSEGTRITVE